MRRQTTGRSLVLTAIGIVLAAIMLSALWTWNPNKTAWEDWVLVSGWWLTSVGFWSLIAYAVWVGVKPRQHWLPAVAASILVVCSILFFTVGPTVADFVALLGISVAAAIAAWSARYR